MTIPERLRLIVKNHMALTGTKQAFIASKCGYTPVTFSQMINGFRKMGADDLERICIGLDITPSQAHGWEPIEGFDTDYVKGLPVGRTQAAIEHCQQKEQDQEGAQQ